MVCSRLLCASGTDEYCRGQYKDSQLHQRYRWCPTPAVQHEYCGRQYKDSEQY
jgi:hypothetical protein